MVKAVANIIANDTFGAWLTKTNVIADALSNEILTVNDGIFTYETVASVQANNIPTAVTHIQTSGYYTTDDGGAARYARAGSEPTHGFKVQSADGTWWEGVPEKGAVHIKQFGAKSDGVTDDAAAVQDALNFWRIYRYAYAATVIVSPNTAIGSTLLITSIEGRSIHVRGEGAKPSNESTGFLTFKWIGASGGTMMILRDIILFEMSDIGLDGENTADYGLKFEGVTTGWGLSKFEDLNIAACNKNAVLKTVGSSWGGGAADFGRNHFIKCSFHKSNAASGTAKDDAVFAYDQDASVLDVFDHCEFIHKSGGVPVTNGYGIYVQSGSPRLHFNNCYTVAHTGFSGLQTPKLVFVDHYSEDINFLNLVNQNTHVMVRNANHVTSGGVSVSWGGAAGGGKPFILDGGSFLGSLSFTNVNAPVIISNCPTFLAGKPTFSEPETVVWIGRNFNATAAGSESPGAINSTAFVPYEHTSQSTTVYPELYKGSIFPVLLTGNASIVAPLGMSPQGLDVGREIEFRIKDNGTGPRTVTFNSVFKLAGGSYTHSGVSKTDIIAFRWDGTNWWETRRSMNMS